MQPGSDEIKAFWDDYAAHYDEAPDHGLRDVDTRAAWKDILRTWLPSRPSDVADLACGTGSLTSLTAELGHHVLAFDLSPEMVARAKAKTALYGAAVTVAQADVSEPPLQRQSLDAVLSRHILWTLPDPQLALRRWMGALRPGGRLVLVEGRWDIPPTGQMPWAGGVTADQLRETLEPMADGIRVVPLLDPVLWGSEINDERYLLVATAATP